MMLHDGGCPKPKDLKPVIVSGGHRELEWLRLRLRELGKEDQYQWYAEHKRYCPYCDMIEGIGKVGRP